MTVYRLIELLTKHCAAHAKVGNVKLWWSGSREQLYISERKPVADAEEITQEV